MGNYFSLIDAWQLEFFFKKNWKKLFVTEVGKEPELLKYAEIYRSGRSIVVNGHIRESYQVMFVSESGKRLFPLEFAGLNQMQHNSLFRANHKAFD